MNHFKHNATRLLSHWDTGKHCYKTKQEERNRCCDSVFFQSPFAPEQLILNTAGNLEKIYTIKCIYSYKSGSLILYIRRKLELSYFGKLFEVFKSQNPN